MHIGTARLEPVIELERASYPLWGFFGSVSREEILHEASWAAPEHIDLDTEEVILSYHSWLVDTGRYKILIDPCVGNHKPRQVFAIHNQLDTPWLDRLAAAGAHPDEIDFVLCTHLHPDHCGWNTCLQDGKWVPTFRNARYIFSRAERDFWGVEAQGLPSPELYNAGLFLDSVKPVIDAGQALIFDGTLDLAGCLHIFPTPGHTPGHVSAILEAGDDGIMFSGDVIHHPFQVIHPTWSVGVDTRDVRRKLLDITADRRLLLAPAHFRASHACRIARAGEAFTLEWAPSA